MERKGKNSFGTLKELLFSGIIRASYQVGGRSSHMWVLLLDDGNLLVNFTQGNSTIVTICLS